MTPIYFMPLPFEIALLIFGYDVVSIISLLLNSSSKRAHGLALQESTYYENVHYGYCHGTQTAWYVREILSRYDAYVEHIPQ
jgi:hypothetical protein